jgi:hypothetical protein
MARLLRDLDYNRIIKAENLEQIISEYQSIKLDLEQTAQQEMISKLSQRYITDQIFTNTTVWDVTKQYKGKNLVEYTEDAFDDTATYTGHAQYVNSTAYVLNNIVSYKGYLYTANGSTTGNLPTDTNYWTKGQRSPRVSYKGKIYEAKSAVTGILPTDTTSWLYICEDLALYYVTLPYSEWKQTETYAPGYTRWFLDKTYTALKGSKNLIPTDYPEFWGTGTSYTTAAGVLPDDDSIWTAGDNRNALVVTYLLDMVMYHLLSRMPRNFSDVRKERYDGNSPQQTGGAIGWLKRVASGDDNADLPEKLTGSQLSIMHGSARIKQRNFLW